MTARRSLSSGTRASSLEAGNRGAGEIGVNNGQSVAMRTKLAFGVGASAEAAIGITFSSFNFLFYNNVLGLSGTLCGLAVTVALMFDAVSDPLIGSISDRWRSRFGRRHPFLYAAPIPLGISFYCIYIPPAALEGLSLFLWFTTFTILFRTFMTFYHVPHLALGAELTSDYRERSVVMSYNSIFGVVGGASAFFLGWTYFGTLEGGTSYRPGYSSLAGAVAIAAGLVIYASAWFMRDQIPRLSKVGDDLPDFGLRQLIDEMWGCIRNPNYLMLLFGLFFLSATLGTRETLNAYVNLFFWELPEGQIRYFAFASPPGFVVAFIFTARFHSWFDKRETIIASICGTVVAASAPIILRMLGYFPENGTAWLFPLLSLGVFSFYASIAILNISVMSALADVADEHELATGRRQEGIFYSARTFFSKLTSGLGHLLAGIAIDVIGFPLGARVGEVASDVLWKLGLVDGPIASIPALIAIFFYARYRISKTRHSQIQQALLARRQTGTPSPGELSVTPTAE